MGRPRRKSQPADILPIRHHHQERAVAANPPANDSAPAPAPAPAPANLPTMYSINGAEILATSFGRVTSAKARWKLVRDGKIASVRIGRRVFLTEQAISDFIAKGGAM